MCMQAPPFDGSVLGRGSAYKRCLKKQRELLESGAVNSADMFFGIPNAATVQTPKPARNDDFFMKAVRDMSSWS